MNNILKHRDRSWDDAETAAHSDRRGSDATFTLREKLIRQMGLAYDPLSSGVTEKDLAPDFGSIYVDVQPELLAVLQRREVSLIFAPAGMGKTATRLALEFALRLDRNQRILAVTYLPQLTRFANIETGPGTDEQRLSIHLRELTAEACIDLLVQAIERFPERVYAPDEPQQRIYWQALRRQAAAAPPVLSRLLRKAQLDAGPDGVLWRGLRSVVRHVAVTDSWKRLLSTLAAATRGEHMRQVSWEECLYDSRALGFEAAFVLIDAIDDGSFEAETFFEVIRPLFAAIDELQKQGVYLKCFLPLAVRPLIESYLDVLTLTPKIATIDSISAESLQRLIGERFVAASMSMASFRSLDWLGQELGESIQERLVTIAEGSPRRLLELASALLDFHSANGFRDGERLWLKQAEWRQFLEVVEHHAWQ
jgi:hypothetical protein